MGTLNSAKRSDSGAFRWLFAALIALFLLICLRYAGMIHLWGDEAFSLRSATQGWRWILRNRDAHLPTYYLLLHPLIDQLGLRSELALRMVHAFVFAGGLIFCWLIASRLLDRSVHVLWLMAATIILPNYIFYATNLRMYALLFFFSMSFVWTAFKLLDARTSFRTSLFAYLFTGFILCWIDYPGLLLFVVVSAFLLFNQAFRKGKLRLVHGKSIGLLVLGFFAAVLLAFLVTRSIPEIDQWPVLRSMALPSDPIRSLAKQVFFALRPILDLVYPPTYPIAVNLFLWTVILVGFALSIGVIIPGGGPHHALVALLASYWILGGLLQIAFTRVFLPTQFFTLLAMAIAWEKQSRHRRILMSCCMAVALVSITLANIQQVVDPTIRIYSRIPYSTIAADAIQIAHQRDLTDVAISRHTLNAISIEHYARPILPASMSLKLLDSKITCPSFPRGRFLYIHIMPEDGDSSDPLQACGSTQNVHYELLRGYVNLNQLNYNRLWQASLQDKAQGVTHAVRLAEVTISARY